MQRSGQAAAALKGWVSRLEADIFKHAQRVSATAWFCGRTSVFMAAASLLTNPGKIIKLNHSGSSTFLQRGSPPPPPWRLLPNALYGCISKFEHPLPRKRGVPRHNRNAAFMRQQGRTRE